MKSTLVLAAALIFSPSAFASPSLGSLLAKLPIPSSPPNREVDSCRNFSGSWHGQCVDSDGVIEDSDLTIEQSGCQLVNIGNMVKLGEIKTETTIGTEARTFANSLSWNDDQTVLNFVANGIGAGPMTTSFEIWINFSILNGQLIEKQISRSRKIGDGLGGTVYTYESTCTYDAR